MGKECDKCGATFKGFGSTCSPCRKGGKAGAAVTCEQCGSFFIGTTTTCEDCAKGRGLGRTGVRLPTPEEIDATLTRISSSMQKVDASQHSMVKLRKAETDLLVQLEIVRDLMQRVVESKNKSLLRDTFGDCGRIARLGAFLDSIHLSELNSEDRRLSNCGGVHRNIIAIIENDFDGEDQMASAQEQAKNALLMQRVEFCTNQTKVDAAQREMNASRLKKQPKCHGDYASAYVQAGPTTVQIHQVDHEPKFGLDMDLEENEDADMSDWSDADIEEMSKEQAGELLRQNARELFEKLDIDGDKSLTKEEVMSAGSSLLGLLRKCKIRKRKHIIKMFAEGDLDNSGTIDFEEFVAYIEKARSKASAAAPKQIDDEKVKKVFYLMDKDGDGSITKEELKLAYAAVLLQAGEPVDPKRISSWARRNFKKYDVDGGGTLDINEFKQLLSHSGALAPMLSLEMDLSIPRA